MSQSITLYTFQKNTDLHALSAQSTIKNFLNCDKIIHCRRFNIWDIKVDCVDAKQWVSTIVDKTYHLLNTNKEDYYINHIPLAEKNGATHICIRINTELENNYD